MRRFHVLGLAAVVAALTVPADGSAQIADRIKRERMERERIERERDRYDRYDRYDGKRAKKGKAGKASGGPAFCRSGRGHPVHGRRWCDDKGFGLGRDDYRWDRVGWGDVIFRDGRDRRRDDRYDPRDRRDDRDRDRDRRDGGWLQDVVGDIVFGRLTQHSRSVGFSGPLVGEWFDDERARVLSVYAGGRPLAELVDRNRDGRVDDVMLVRTRR